ncbi:MAG: DinB family protein [Terriglobia bacterium]
MKTLKRREWLTKALGALGVVTLGRTALRAKPPERRFATEFGADWELAKAYTLEVAEAMPAEKYDFKPSAEMRSFGELMAHTAGAMFRFASGVRGERPGVAPPKEPTKEAVVAFLRGACDYVAESVAQIDDTRAEQSIKLFGGRLEMPVWKLFHFLRDHTTHHRAYGLPYLRLCGVQPPRYRFSGTRPSPV